MATNYTLDELADIEGALATGALRVTHGGTTTEYRSREEMISIISLMRQALGLPLTDAPSNGLPRVRRLRLVGTKGL